MLVYHGIIQHKVDKSSEQMTPQTNNYLEVLCGF